MVLTRLVNHVDERRNPRTNAAVNQLLDKHHDDETLEEKDTKTHQQRGITLDAETLLVLQEHRERCASRAAELGLDLEQSAFVLSLHDGGACLRPIR